MAGTLTTTAEQIIAQCDAGIYEPHDGNSPLDLLARGMIETYTGSLEKAKDLLSQAYRGLDGLWKARAQVQLAVAYYRGGEKREAMAFLDGEPATFEALLMRAIIETDHCPERALRILRRAESFDVSRYMWGRLHNQKGICLRRLGRYAEARQEYQAVLFFWRDSPFYSTALNNLAAATEDLTEAHGQIDGAIKDLDGPCLAQAYDLKAKTLLAQGENERAAEYAGWAVGLLEATERRGWLAECLLTHADTLVACQKLPEAIAQMAKAWEIGSYLGDSEIQFKSARSICTHSKALQKVYHVRTVQIALDRAPSVRAAARDLGVTHQAMRDFMQVHDLKSRRHRE